MLLKPQEKGIYHLKLEAFDKRLHGFHPAKRTVQEELIRAKRGARGEREVSFPLSFLSQDEYRLLHNLRIPHQDSHFEIDSFIPHKNFITMAEVKNWYGTIYFDGERQVVRKRDDGTEEGMPNPIPQVKLQRHRLRQLLNNEGFPHIPIKYLVVFSSPSTILKPLFPHSYIPEEVIHSNLLFHKINQLHQQYQTPILDTPTFNLICNNLLAKHVPKDRNILEKFGVGAHELLKGVFCPACSRGPMVREHQKWHCTQCGQYSYDAHMAALNDYFLLISDRITNREARGFLMVDPHM